jgi:hypothetical protein
MITHMTGRFRTWIAALAARFSRAPHASARRGGMLVEVVVYDPTTTDEIGDRIGCRRYRGESDHDYRHRMQILLTEEIIAREEYERLLDRLITASLR